MRLALIADIHGNAWALEAVLDDLARRGVSEILNLGDSVYGPLGPAATADRLIAAGVPSVRGNQDRILLEAPGGAVHPTFAYTASQLSTRHFEWLRSQPHTLQQDDVFCCHGTPADDAEYLLEAVNAAGAWLRRPDEVAALVKGIDATLIACGHSHVPRVTALADGTLVVNPGSVGLPAYSDDSPFPHRMETGSPHARYAIAERVNGRWSVDSIAIPYDWSTAAQHARRNGREDWATALESGYTAQ
jgi:putative phosphoesterase